MAAYIVVSSEKKKDKQTVADPDPADKGGGPVIQIFFGPSGFSLVLK